MKPLRSFFALFCITAATCTALPDSGEIRTGFALLDLDKDQRITAEEWAQHSFALFKVADLNDDQQLAAPEIEFDSDTENTFVRADANHDGKLSVDEFMQLRRALFKIADINGGDFINNVEYTIFRLLQVTGWKDQNHNGRINFSELRLSLADLHEQADIDHDWELSSREASFLSIKDYQHATAEGPLTPQALYELFRFHLTGE